MTANRENNNISVITAEYRDSFRNKENVSRKPTMEYYNNLVYIKSNKYNVEASLISAMIKVESNWNIKAVSDKGATGLMQLMPSTAREMAVKNPRNPEENIEGGIRYLRYLLDKFDGDVALALAAYNAGPGRVERYRGIPPITETQLYVEKVLSIYHGKNPVDRVPPPQI